MSNNCNLFYYLALNNKQRAQFYYKIATFFNWIAKYDQILNLIKHSLTKLPVSLSEKLHNLMFYSQANRVVDNIRKIVQNKDAPYSLEDISK